MYQKLQEDFKKVSDKSIGALYICNPKEDRISATHARNLPNVLGIRLVQTMQRSVASTTGSTSKGSVT